MGVRCDLRLGGWVDASNDDNPGFSHAISTKHKLDRNTFRAQGSTHT